MFQNNVRKYVFALEIDRMLLSMFCTWFVTLWKSSFPRNPPTPWKLPLLNPPSPSEFPMIFRGGGGAVWIFSGTTQCMKLKYLMQYSASVNSVHNLLAKSMMQKLHGLTYLVLLNKNNWHWKGGKRNKWFKNNWNNIKTAASGGKWFRNRKCLKNTVMSKISVSLKSKQN